MSPPLPLASPPNAHAKPSHGRSRPVDDQPLVPRFSVLLIDSDIQLSPWLSSASESSADANDLHQVVRVQVGFGFTHADAPQFVPALRPSVIPLAYQSLTSFAQSIACSYEGLCALIIGNIPAIEWLTLSITSVRAADRLLRAGVRTTMSSPEPTANAPSVSTCPSSLPACSRSCQQTARASSELRHHLRCTSAARVVRHRSSRRSRRRCGSPAISHATNSTTRR